MGEQRSMPQIWTRIVCDAALTICQITNPDDKLFFGRMPRVGQTLANAIGSEHAEETAVIDENLHLALRERSNVRFDYTTPLPGGGSQLIGAHACWLGDGRVSLDLLPLGIDHCRRAKRVAEGNVFGLPDAVFDNLPVGLEIFDSQGVLIDINAYEMRMMGYESKDVIGKINLFDNSNLPDQARADLLAGRNTYFVIEYDFDLVKDYYATTKRDRRNLEVSISIVRNGAGELDKYIIISQDITDRTALQRQYEELYSQNTTILNSLHVGVGVYDTDGQLIFLNDTICSIFGVDRQSVLAEAKNLYDDPTVPGKIKDAVRYGTPIQLRFPYRTTKERNPLAEKIDDLLQIECTGRPIVGVQGNNKYYAFIISNITEAARKEEELQQSRRKTEMAIYESDIMLWEFDVVKNQFFSDNEPINGYDRTNPIPAACYVGTAHEEDREVVKKIIERMQSGEDFSYAFDARILFPNNPDWQYCTVSGSPYEKDAEGRVLKFVGTRKNNTKQQRKRMLLDKILNSIPLSIHIKDVEDNFRYVFCNEESKCMFGTSEEKKSLDVMEPAEVARIQKTDLEVYTTGNPYFGMEHIKLRDGRSYDTVVRKSIIEDDGKRLLLNIRWDQSLQNDLQRRAKVLSLSMEAMNAYTWFFNPEKGEVSYSEGIEREGRDVSRLDTLTKYVECIHPDDRQLFRDSIDAVLAKESGEWAVEYRIDMNGDGVYEWWETRGTLDTSTINDAPCRYMLGMSICIEGHKQTELTLRRNEEDLAKLIQQNELVINNTNSGLAYITTDYIVQWENVSKCSASLSYEAYKKGELCFKSAHNRTSPCENCVLQRAMVSRQMERINFTLDSAHIVEVFATPVFNNQDGLDGVVIRVDDVTERERMIAELQQAKAAAEQSDKLKSAFLANMSHEIRTPLNAIVGFSELLINTPEEEVRNEYMAIINNNNDLLLKLINDILDLSKIEAGSVELKYEVFDLSVYFDGLAASMQQRVKNPNVRLVAQNPYPQCIVDLDRNRIAQILTNYVTNAIKYTPKGFIEMGYSYQDGMVRFYVRDTGIGISEQKKCKVFQRFEKLDEFAQGTGLGLSICKAIAESMRGCVGFESVEGEGSLFWAELPCQADIDAPTPAAVAADSAQTTAAPESVKPAADRHDKNRKTILIAEDIASNYLLISSILRRHFDLLHAVNGAEAVEIARNSRVDLVLMDMKMPVMDGLRATAEIRKFNSELPIVALTAHAFDADREAALAAGCNDYLVKPIDKSKLGDVLRKYCGRSF